MNESENTRDAILRCTQSLIVAGGYNGFSYADIAKVVGIRNASIHHHFPTKANLVRELVVHYRQRVAEGLAELDRAVPQPLQRVRAYGGYWQACIADGSLPICVCALLSTEIPVLPAEIAGEVRGHFESLRGWLASVFRAGVREKQIHLDRPAAVEAELFMASVHGALLSARAYGDAKVFGTIMNSALARLAVN
jgi:TetR/AcrR family transcriptional repressor of nem operon